VTEIYRRVGLGPNAHFPPFCVTRSHVWRLFADKLTVAEANLWHNKVARQSGAILSLICHGITYWNNYCVGLNVLRLAKQTGCKNYTDGSLARPSISAPPLSFVSWLMECAKLSGMDPCGRLVCRKTTTPRRSCNGK